MSFDFKAKKKKWKVGMKWDDRRYVAQGKYYHRVGKKKSASRMWGKAGAIKRYKPKGVYIPTWEEYLEDLPEPEYYEEILEDYEIDVDEQYWEISFDFRPEKET